MSQNLSASNFIPKFKKERSVIKVAGETGKGAFIDTRFNDKFNEPGFGDILINPFGFLDTYEIERQWINYNYILYVPLSATAMRVFFEMVVELEEDKNYVYYRASKSRTTTNGAAAIRNLIEKEFVVQADKESLYIINHNIAFKGNLNEFKKKYLNIYGEAEPLYDYKGRVVVTREYDKTNSDFVRKNITQTTFKDVKNQFAHFGALYNPNI